MVQKLFKYRYYKIRNFLYDILFNYMYILKKQNNKKGESK